MDQRQQFRNPDYDFLRLIALRIKQLRVEKDITQQEFTDDTGIHISRVESGRRNISVSTLRGICNYLKISVTEFFSGIDKGA